VGVADFFGDAYDDEEVVSECGFAAGDLECLCFEGVGAFCLEELVFDLVECWFVDSVLGSCVYVAVGASEIAAVGDE